MRHTISRKAVCLFWILAIMPAGAQTLTTLGSFMGFQGFVPFSSLVQGRDGNLYGTAYNGGTYGQGTAFRITPSGTLSVIHDFCAQSNCTDGANPGGLALATDGNLYGTTYYGGAPCSQSGYGGGCGTVFKMTPAGTVTVLHSFDGNDGNNPVWLIEGGDKDFYGAAQAGGSENGGTIFRMTSTGALRILHNFAGGTSGFLPTGVVQGTDGFLYGTTYAGGISDPDFCYLYGCGTIFRATTGGAFTVLHSFHLADGANPYVPPTQAPDGTFYGTSSLGAGKNTGDDGVVYSITPERTFAVEYQFSGTAVNPTVGLSLGDDGNLYGTVWAGGTCSQGFIYSVSRNNAFSTVYDGGCEVGGYSDSVVQATSGLFYGTAGNSYYSLNTGLGPFIEFVIPSGKAGQTVQILGQGLIGSTAVTFNGTEASSFSVVSDRYMTAVVPSSATAGPVVVTTPSGQLTSNVSFNVTK